MDVDPERLRLLGDGLDRVRERIARACAETGRRPEEVTLIVVTKTYPSADLRALAELGVRELGESREQELVTKAAECADIGFRWHFIGQLQTNKARRLSRIVDVVHSVDRVKLVDALGTGAEAADRTLDCLIQVRLDELPGRGGALPRDVARIAEEITVRDRLNLVGMMAVAPRGEPARPAFATLARIHDQLLRDHPEAWMLSAGMSTDLEEALAEGATHLRVGSAILGPRRSLGYGPDRG